MTLTFRVDDRNLRRRVNRAVRELRDTQQSRHPLRKLDREKKRRISADWRKARVTGADVDGAHWGPLRPPPNPPWGGRPKVRGRGVTKGKLRYGHDGRAQRVNPNSRLMIVSWILFRAVIHAPTDIRNNTLRIGLRAMQTVPGARRLFRLRPLVWTARDRAFYRTEARAFLKWVLR